MRRAGDDIHRRQAVQPRCFGVSLYAATLPGRLRKNEHEIQTAENYS
jgi:hypothetical protein